jgi:5-methylcytosine-specific restriction endonuclease McrA
MFPKKKRIKNRKLRDSFHTRSCCICDSTIGVVGHHLVSVGAGGDDTEFNMIALCGFHHAEAHSQGSETFKKKYMQ